MKRFFNLVCVLSAIALVSGCELITEPNADGFLTQDYLYVAQAEIFPTCQEVCDGNEAMLKITMKNRHCPQDNPSAHCTYDEVPSTCEDFELQIQGLEVNGNYDSVRSPTDNIIRAIPGSYDQSLCKVKLTDRIRTPAGGKAFIAIGKIKFKGQKVTSYSGPSYGSPQNLVLFTSNCQ